MEFKLLNTFNVVQLKARAMNLIRESANSSVKREEEKIASPIVNENAILIEAFFPPIKLRDGLLLLTECSGYLLWLHTILYYNICEVSSSVN